MNEYNLNYLAHLERERNFWKKKYFDLMEQTKRLFFFFLIAMGFAVIALLSSAW